MAKSIERFEQQLLPTWWAFQILHIGFFSFSTKPFIRIKTYCLCIDFEKVLKIPIFQTCSMSTLESTSCQPDKKPKHLEQSHLIKDSFWCCYRVLYQILPLHWSTLDLLAKWTTPLLTHMLVTALSITLQDVVTFYYYIAI